ncbi:MAG: hypothetical protein ACXVEF_39290 [Polyangiales bacterium]
MGRRAIAIIALVTACRGAHDAAPTDGPSACDGECPVTFDACDDVSVAVAGGGCTTVGVPKDACAPGFVHDPARATCDPILPAAACPAGKMAVPGDTECRDVAPCTGGKWGELPDGVTPLHVDASYAGTDSDGSEARPYSTVQAAVDAARPDDVVAIAAGHYVEDITVRKPIRLYGVCPSLVTLEGVGTDRPVVQLWDAVEVHRVAVTGPSTGVGVIGAKGALVDQVWIHDLGDAGVFAASYGRGHTTMTVKRSLVDGAEQIGGLSQDDAVLTLDASVIRGTRARSGQLGIGVFAQRATGAPAPRFEITGSLVERNHAANVVMKQGSALVDGSVIRNTLTGSWEGNNGVGMGIFVGGFEGTEGKLEVRRSLVAGALASGIDVYNVSTATVESTVVRDIAGKMVSGRLNGHAIEASNGAVLSVRDSVVERTAVRAAQIAGATATFERTIFREPTLRAGACCAEGQGIFIVQIDDRRSTVHMFDSLLLDFRMSALLFYGSDVDVHGSRIARSQPRDGEADYGDGIDAAWNGAGETTLLVEDTLVEGNARAGVALFGATGSFHRVGFRCNVGFDLNGSQAAPTAAMTHDFAFTDGGANSCGCGATTASCRVSTDAIAAIGKDGL